MFRPAISALQSSHMHGRNFSDSNSMHSMKSTLSRGSNDKCKLRDYCQPPPICRNKNVKKFVSMWEPPKDLRQPYGFRSPSWSNECCGPLCEKPFPRFDEMFYKPSCKESEYQRTWVECPEYLLRKRKTCCYKKLTALEPARRVSAKRDRPLSPPTKKDCLKDSDLCIKLAQLAGCKAGRVPPKCTKYREPTCCRKLCAPQPSWSECKKPELMVPYLPPPECFCPTPVSQCQVLAYREWVKKYGAPKNCRQPKKCSKNN